MKKDEQPEISIADPNQQRPRCWSTWEGSHCWRSLQPPRARIPSLCDNIGGGRVDRDLASAEINDPPDKGGLPCARASLSLAWRFSKATSNHS